MDMKAGLKQMKQTQDYLRWDQTRRFHRSLKQNLDSYREENVRLSVARKREIEQLFAAKCRVVLEKSGPSEGEIVRDLIGNSGMMSKEIRDMTHSILKKKGMIKHQTIHEKYQKVFDKYTLTDE